MGDIFDVMNLLGYKSPEQRRWDAHFQQPGNMSLQGLQSFVEANPDLANSNHVKDTLALLTNFEQSKQNQQQADIQQRQIGLQEQRLGAEQAATQRELDAKALEDNQRAGISSLFNAFGPQKTTELIANYGGAEGYPKDIVDRAQKQVDTATATAARQLEQQTGFQQDVKKMDIQRQNQEAATLLDDKLARGRLGITLANQKTMADYEANIAAGKPVKPPAGWIDTGGGKLAPVPGTKAHTEAVTGVNALNNTLSLIDKYQNLATGNQGLLAGKTAQEADQLQNILAQQIAQANNPGRAPTDKDIEAAKQIVPSITGVWDREKGARKLGVLRSEFLKKQQQAYGLVRHYPGVQDYTPELPAGFTIIKGK
jgi:hypothetical protein